MILLFAGGATPFGMKRLLYLLLLFLALTAFRTAERDPFVEDYFQAPVRGGLLLSGTFGELRSNHFHAGIDVKGGMNVPILAAADGYVSRINVSGSGYGNVLYIDHPRGYTTVYAHLNAFEDEIAAWVEEQQYVQESFSVDLQPEPGQFPVRQGQQIALMGTTGSSSGPHLHFEIREKDTQVPLNPLRFGLQLASSTSLRVHELKVYEMDEREQVLRAREYSPRYQSGGYVISGDTIYVQSPTVGVALKAYDHMNNGRNWNGIYGLDMRVKDELSYRFRMDALPFAERRYLNAHLDYAEHQTERSFYNRCFLLPGNASSIYQQVHKRGLIHLQPGESVPVTMQVYGADDQTREVRFWLKHRGGDIVQPPEDHQYWLEYEQENIISNYHLFLHFPEGSLYEDVPMRYQQTNESSYRIFSPIHQIHDPLTPLHEAFTIGIRPTLLPDSLRSKAFVGRCTQSGRIVNYGGEWKDGMLVSRSHNFGDYGIFVDDTPPTITAERFSGDMRGWSYLRFRIDDDLPTSGLAADLRFRATIDDQWVLMVYDAKRDRLTYSLEGLDKGEHTFRLEVTDAMGNQAVFNRDFVY